MEYHVIPRFVRFDDKEEATKAVLQSAATYNGSVIESPRGDYLAAVLGEDLLMIAKWCEGAKKELPA
jgi:hypothetical protein